MVKDKIVILGASGFIGMHLCRKLINKNVNLLALVRNKKSKEAKKLLKMNCLENSKKKNLVVFLLKIEAYILLLEITALEKQHSLVNL